MAADPHPRIPVASVDLGRNEERYVVDALRGTWVSSTGLADDWLAVFRQAKAMWLARPAARAAA
jgi:hypothetical protein